MEDKKDIFPFIGAPEDYNYTPDGDLPLLRELAYDFDKDDFIIENSFNGSIIGNW